MRLYRVDISPDRHFLLKGWQNSPLHCKQADCCNQFWYDARATAYTNSFLVNGAGAQRKRQDWKRFRPSSEIVETKNLSFWPWWKIFSERISIPWKWPELTIG